jgi:hypothetical protein
MFTFFPRAATASTTTKFQTDPYLIGGKKDTVDHVTGFKILRLRMVRVTSVKNRL